MLSVSWHCICLCLISAQYAMGFGPSHAVLPCGGTRISAGLHPIKSLYMSSGKDLHSQKVSVVDNDVLRSFYSSRRKVIFPIGAGLLTAFLGSRAGEAADLAESFMEEMGGSDFQGVDVKFAFPKTWKFDRKEGTLLVNDEARAACDADPDKCLFGEVFARSPGGDSAYLLQSTTSSDGDVTMIPFSFFKTQVFNRGGKFGAYGAPEDVKIVTDTTKKGLRQIDVKFIALSPGGTSIQRRGIIAVEKAGPEAYMLVCTTSMTRWKSDEPLLREIATSFSAKSTGRPAPPQKKFEGIKKSMFAGQNEERNRLEKERKAEGIQ